MSVPRKTKRCGEIPEQERHSGKPTKETVIPSLLHRYANRVAEHSQKEVKDYEKKELRELYKMMFPDYPDIVTVAQLHKMLGINRHLAYDLINDGYISGMKIGNAFKIPKVNIINYVMEEGDEKNAG